MNYETIKNLLDDAVSQVSYLHAQRLEEAIEFAIRENCYGKIPPLEEVRRRGLIMKCAQGDDVYTEFQWDGQAQFRQRVLFNPDKGQIEIRIDYAP